MDNAESLRMQLNLYIFPSATGTTTQACDIILSFCILLTFLCRSSKTKRSFINSESLRSDCFIHLPLAVSLVIVEKSHTKARKTISVKKRDTYFIVQFFFTLLNNWYMKEQRWIIKHLVTSVSNLFPASRAICFPVGAYVRSLTQQDLPRQCKSKTGV